MLAEYRPAFLRVVALVLRTRFCGRSMRSLPSGMLRPGKKVIVGVVSDAIIDVALAGSIALPGVRGRKGAPASIGRSIATARFRVVGTIGTKGLFAIGGLARIVLRIRADISFRVSVLRLAGVRIFT